MMTKLLSLRERQAVRITARQLLSARVISREDAEEMLRRMDEMPFIVEGVL